MNYLIYNTPPNFYLLAFQKNSASVYHTGDFIATRFFEGSHSTLSEFHIYGTSIHGYGLERNGPETTLEGMKRRVPADEYYMQNHPVSAHARANPSIHKPGISEDFVPGLFNNDVPAGRGVLVHNGNNYSDGIGCYLVGSTYTIANGEAHVYNSQALLHKIVLHYNLYHITPKANIGNKSYIKDSTSILH